ncbi:MAG: hypothetical protein NC084_08105 [Bacteroides sp.]|nr:hypothetical protein [Eubacterium sp.]MCM1418604.1 hypothetical protein [Roseburia sp.]MCM1462658.1 hypothetical protein [Bacteroides sp.]
MATDEMLQRIAEEIDSASRSLFNAIRYCYQIGDEDFYNINVKDVFKIGLNKITDYDCFKNLGLTLEEDSLGEMGGEGFSEVLSVIRYSFAVRLPFMRRYAEATTIKDNQLKQIYDTLEGFGFANPDGIVEDSYKSMVWLVRTKKNEPAFETEWYRRWIYTYGHDLAAINNKNMLMLGCVEALFPLYYASLQDLVVAQMNEM